MEAHPDMPAIEKQHGIRRQMRHLDIKLSLWRLRIGYARTLGTCGKQCADSMTYRERSGCAASSDGSVR